VKSIGPALQGLLWLSAGLGVTGLASAASEDARAVLVHTATGSVVTPIDLDPEDTAHGSGSYRLRFRRESWLRAEVVVY
jgi:hypothetical protein